MGHKLIGRALQQARENSSTVATLPAHPLARPLIVFQITDKVTSDQKTVRSVTVGAHFGHRDRSDRSIVIT